MELEKLLIIVKCFWFFLPIGIANIMPALTVKIFKPLAIPVDFGRKWKGLPIFGSHKTIRGLLVATLAGGIVFGIQKILYATGVSTTISLFNYNEFSFWLGFLLGFGAILGDLIKSFFKRRVGITPGKPWIPFDQIDYILGGLLFAFFFFPLDWLIFITVLLLGISLHFLTNLIGWFFKIKPRIV